MFCRKLGVKMKKGVIKRIFYSLASLYMGIQILFGITFYNGFEDESPEHKNRIYENWRSKGVVEKLFTPGIGISTFILSRDKIKNLENQLKS